MSRLRRVVTFYHDGKLVRNQPFERMVQLMGAQAEQ